MPSISWNFTSMISIVGGLDDAADEAGFDRQLAVAAVDQHQQRHARGPAVVEQRVERGAHGAAGVEHVIHQDDVLALHGKRDFGGVHDRLDLHGGKIVAIEVDIEDADRNLAVFEGLDLGRQALRQRHAAAADSDEGELVEIRSFPGFHGPAGPASGRFRTRSSAGLFRG